MDIETFMARVRARCAPHRNGVGGFCQLCFQQELAEVIHEEHPEMKRDDAIDIVSAWILAQDRPLH